MADPTNEGDTLSRPVSGPLGNGEIIPAVQTRTLEFLSGVAEKLGWYVYALRDPLKDNAIFYVGKGKGDRVYQHARYALSVDDVPAQELKLATIQAIHAAGHEVGVEIIRHQIQSATVAYEIEAAVMDALMLSGVNLQNIVKGRGTSVGWLPIQEIIASYSAAPVSIAEDHRVVLIRINHLYRSDSSAEQLYEATRKWWRMAPHQRKPDYAFSVYDGIVRAVYRIEPQDWVQRADDGRWAFHGQVEPAMERLYVWRNVSDYLSQGAQNPIKYVNC